MRNDFLPLTYDSLRDKYRKYAKELFSKDLRELDAYQLQSLIAYLIKKDIIKPFFESSKDYFSTQRIAIYLSMEFLIGRVVLDALMNTGIKELTSEIFLHEDIDINILEDIDDAALGNGGLGRLAACFVESAATTGIPLFGFGIYYKYGLFKQQFQGHAQVEIPDDWTSRGDPWFEADYSQTIIVHFNDTAVKAVPFVMPVIGYNKGDSAYEQCVHPLTLWKAEPIEGITKDYAAQISDYLYPNDADDDGKRLRICQEYFFTSATMQKLVNTHLQKHGTLDNFEDFYCLQMNDTHPVLACIEYIRLLEEHGYSFKEASKKAKKCFAYTNHTVMAEALECWNMDLFRSVVPAAIFKILQDLNQELIDEFKLKDFFKNERGEIDWPKIKQFELMYCDDMVHMSRIACYMASHINGVAAIHTEILKDSVLHGWYELYPHKFLNCTNGVTQRHWIRGCNPNLAVLLDSKIGPGWITSLDELQRLEDIKSTPLFLTEFLGCRVIAKENLTRYIKLHEGIDINPDSIFDCHVKRIHEYKRQLMNAFRILYFYDRLKKDMIPNFYPVTFIIGGKAAPSYVMAKRIIALLKDIQETINNDPDMDGKMRVVFVTNFNVSYGEKIYSAADFSEQISTAGTEASGTGNMKFMFNGAPTIGTMDGANVEIVKAAGLTNNYIFGATVEELRNLTYVPHEFMNNSHIMQIIMPYLTGGLLSDNYSDIVNHLRNNDKYFVMYDLESYICASKRAFNDYADERALGIPLFYRAKALENIIHCGIFSSDRTIRNYADSIWHVSSVTL